MEQTNLEKFFDPVEMVIDTVLMKMTDIDEKTKQEVAEALRKDRNEHISGN